MSKELRAAYRVLVLRGDLLEDSSVDWRIILKWLFEKCDGAWI
jgi:hypothetical protein